MFTPLADLQWDSCGQSWQLLQVLLLLRLQEGSLQLLLRRSQGPTLCRPFLVLLPVGGKNGCVERATLPAQGFARAVQGLGLTTSTGFALAQAPHRRRYSIGTGSVLAQIKHWLCMSAGTALAQAIQVSFGAAANSNDAALQACAHLFLSTNLLKCSLCSIFCISTQPLHSASISSSISA